MSEIHTFVVVAIIIFLGVIVYLLRDRLTKLNLDFFRGLIKFNGEASLPTHVPQDTISTAEEEMPFQEQFMSHAVLHILQADLKKTRGHHAILETTTENRHATSTLYGQLHGDIIGTCFFENPNYGEHDLAGTILKTSRFTRITTQDLCDDETKKRVMSQFQDYRARARLIVLDNETEVSKIGGIFCKCDDGSHLAFMALNNWYDATPKNLGLVYCGDIAEQMYKYYKSFVDRYQ